MRPSKNKPVFRTSGFLADVSIVVVAFYVHETAGGVVVADAHIVRVGFSPRPVAVRWLATVVPASHLVQSNPEFSTGGPALMSQIHKAFTGSLLHIGCLKRGVSPPPKHCSSQKNVVKSYFSHRLLEKGISPPQKQRSFVVCFYFYYTVYCCNVSTALCHITVLWTHVSARVLPLVLQLYTVSQKNKTPNSCP